ncbi:MAG: ABC transporter permease, partial [Chloroflexi bacterium]|nr:ABC transporter permease [Chloroflexota bacterium]
MSVSRILAVMRRVAQGFRRDERTLGLMFVVPLVVTALLGWVLTEQKEETVGVVIVNEAGAVGDRIVTVLTEAAQDPERDITVVATVTAVGDAEVLLRDGSAQIGLVIPGDLLATVAAGGRPTFSVITEGTEPTADAGRFGTLQGVMADVVRNLVPPGAPAPVVPQVERRTIYLDPDASQVDVFAPIFLGLFGYFFVYILTGISFLRERVGGTLERLLATPVTRAEIVLGYSLGFGIFANRHGVTYPMLLAGT